jgi:hypothetical protein
MNNTNSNIIFDIVNQLPSHLFFSGFQDRQQCLKYINWLHTNISSSKNVNQDRLFREVIAKGTTTSKAGATEANKRTRNDDCNKDSYMKTKYYLNSQRMLAFSSEPKMNLASVFFSSCE